MPIQATMVYRKASDGATKAFVTEAGLVEYQIVDLDDGDPAPDGWFRTYQEVFSAPVEPPKKTLKLKAEKAADGNSDGN